MLLGVAAALVVGTHLVLTSTPSASAGPAAAPAETVDDPASIAPAADGALEGGSTAIPAQEAPAAEARVTTSPARVRMTPGPAFSGSAPLRPGADTLAPVAATRTAPVAPAPAADAGLAPAPIEMDLALPDLPPDSVVPTARTADTLGMKKILRALNGAKPVEAAAAE